MSFFHTDIALLPSQKYDAGIERWNKLYSGLKAGLIVKYGSAGKSPSGGLATGKGNVPAVPYAVAVGIAMQFAIDLANLIVTFIAQCDETMLVPVTMTDLRISQSESEKRETAIQWLGGEVVRSNYIRYPNDKELRNPAYQHLLDANYRLIVHKSKGDVDILLQTREDAYPETQWLRPAVRAYQNLIWLAYDLHSLSAGGPIKPLTAYGADLFLKRIYESTTWLAIRIPDVSADDVWSFITKRTTEVIEQASGTAADALNWATKTAAGAVNSAVGNLDIFTWLVVGSVGAVLYALS
jgi:hypothetical protein